MRHALILLTALGLGTLAFTADSAAAPSFEGTDDAPRASSEPPDVWEPFEATIVCGAETVEVAGRARFNVRFVETGSGQFKILVNTTIVGEGVGSGGDSYRFHESFSQRFQLGGPVLIFTVSGHANLIGKGRAPNFRFEVLGQLVVDGNEQRVNRFRIKDCA